MTNVQALREDYRKIDNLMSTIFSNFKTCVLTNQQQLLLYMNFLMANMTIFLTDYNNFYTQHYSLCACSTLENSCWLCIFRFCFPCMSKPNTDYLFASIDLPSLLTNYDKIVDIYSNVLNDVSIQNI